MSGVPDPADVLMPNGNAIGTAGTNPSIRIVSGGESDAWALFNELSRGGTDITPPSYPGKLMVLPGGGRVGIRPVSTSGPPTIDVNIPGLKVDKVKFV